MSKKYFFLTCALLCASLFYTGLSAHAAGYVYLKVETAPVKKYIEGSDSAKAKAECSGELSGNRELFLQNARGRKDLEPLVKEINTYKNTSGSAECMFGKEGEKSFYFFYPTSSDISTDNAMIQSVCEAEARSPQGGKYASVDTASSAKNANFMALSRIFSANGFLTKNKNSGICFENKSAEIGVANNANIQNQNTPYTFLAPFEAFGISPTFDPKAGFGEYITLLFQIMISIAGIAAIVMISYGGILYMGSESLFAKNEGKQYIQNAGIGLVFLFGVFLVLKWVAPGILNINPSSIGQQSISVLKSEINDKIGIKYINSKVSTVGNKVVFWAGMQTDADGSPRTKEIDPLYGRTETSLQFGGVSINAENIPYIVLPTSKVGGMGSMADYAIVSVLNKTEPLIVGAIVADAGPDNKLGEGSIQLVKLLGHNPFVGNIIKTGIDTPMCYIVQKGSANMKKSQKYDIPTINGNIQNARDQIIKDIGGKDKVAELCNSKK